MSLCASRQTILQGNAEYTTDKRTLHGRGADGLEDERAADGHTGMYERAAHGDNCHGDARVRTQCQKQKPHGDQRRCGRCISRALIATGAAATMSTITSKRGGVSERRPDGQSITIICVGK